MIFNSAQCRKLINLPFRIGRSGSIWFMDGNLFKGTIHQVY
jgi:hypothetical protein